MGDALNGRDRCFNGKKWEKFNSEKVASLAYACIHGKTTLVAHFEGSEAVHQLEQYKSISSQMMLTINGVGANIMSFEQSESKPRISWL
ncbi:hypothetical protein CTI12_AA025780 [Artemisia annua]|uniref:Mei2-like C-terminal RNA recognition motif domain-containing protein n=1 Tax=Artemisia annua TaxID=35608 RepID=A0A2U1QIK0_ARTAN|nr:hypothetical protein CTI12_AA025780 [Artemisia annua]